AVEVGYDLIAWTCGLLAAAWAISDIAGPATTLWAVVPMLPAAWLLVGGCGLLAGLYRGRHQRGSFAEAFAVTAASVGTAVLLVALTAIVLPGEREPLRTVAAGSVLAVLAMLGPPYV